jgi:hypothetical protein
MKKRVMIQDGDEMDRETGEVKWIDATDEDEVPDEKIFIGRVSLYYRRPDHHVTDFG